MNARHCLSLTLHADNLPETGKRQHENKNEPRRRDRVDVARREKKKLRHNSFRQTKFGVSRRSAASETPSHYLNRRRGTGRAGRCGHERGLLPARCCRQSNWRGFSPRCV
jgi:hypothetical protein